MPSWNDIAESLTNATGGRVDFFNVGGLAKQRTQKSLMGLWTHYSWREYFINGSMMAVSLALGVWSAKSCKEEDCYSLTRGVAGTAVGLFATHLFVVIPKIQRRNKIIAATNSTYQRINEKLNNEATTSPECNDLINRMKQVAQESLQLQLPVTRKSQAVMNLVTIKQLMIAIEAKVDEFFDQLSSGDSDDSNTVLAAAQAFWDQPLDSIREQLTRREEEPESTAQLSR